MANNLAVTEQADLFGGSGGWVLSITDQTGSGLTDSFSATGLGFMKLSLIEEAPERVEMFGAGNLEITETVEETISFTATKEVTGGVFAVTEGVTEKVKFTFPDARPGFALALYETLPETLAFTMQKAIDNDLAVSESVAEEFHGTAVSISDSVLRHVRASV